jgi:hypothetical protein
MMSRNLSARGGSAARRFRQHMLTYQPRQHVLTSQQDRQASDGRQPDMD